MAKVDPSRQTGMGLWTDADEMLEAAKLLDASGVHRVLGPTMYLLGHATELGFKSFILSKGRSLDDLKQLGHDLDAGMRSAIDAGLSAVFEVTDRDRAIVALLNPYYRAKEFEYRITGAKQYPTARDLISMLERLLRATRANCLDSLKRGLNA